MRFINCAVFLLVFSTTTAYAQFHTITKDCPVEPFKAENVIQTVDTTAFTDNTLKEDTLNTPQQAKAIFSQKCNRYKSPAIDTYSTDLPALNIENLRKEIRKNGIKFEDIVVAQSLIETGYFRSRVCRELNNLFGLTNPRTGKYYEFNHWTESVKAYYTKVQYRYSQKNMKIKPDVDYLLWLRDLPYAEDKGYIRAIIKMLRNMKE